MKEKQSDRLKLAKENVGLIINYLRKKRWSDNKLLKKILITRCIKSLYIIKYFKESQKKCKSF